MADKRKDVFINTTSTKLSEESDKLTEQQAADLGKELLDKLPAPATIVIELKKRTFTFKKI